MNKDTRNMIIIVVLLLIFTIYRLIGARRIKIPFKYGNRIVIYVIFTIPAIYLVIKNKNLYSVIFALSILLISALYASIPSGFSENGIVLYGRLYKYSKMDSMDVEKNYIDCRLIFEYNKVKHEIIGEKTDEVSYKQILAYYQSVKKVQK